MGTLVNAIKALFTSKKTTDSNYAVALLNKSDASPAGYMELPDLAAVAAGALALKRTAASSSVGTSNYEYYYKTVKEAVEYPPSLAVHAPVDQTQSKNID